MKLDEALFGDYPRDPSETVKLYKGGSRFGEAHGTELELVGLHSLQRRWDAKAERVMMMIERANRRRIRPKYGRATHQK